MFNVYILQVSGCDGHSLLAEMVEFFKILLQAIVTPLASHSQLAERFSIGISLELKESSKMVRRDAREVHVHDLGNRLQGRYCMN